VNLPPFVLAGILNWWYNKEYFVKDLSPDERIAFELLKYPVNGILYPLGIALVLGFAWPVARTLMQLNRGEQLSADELRRARQRSITLGHWVALVGIALWVVAGFAFPVGLTAWVGKANLHAFVHFPLSMLACGIISCCLPFLATTWLCVRVFFPSLLANSTPDPHEQRRLMNLSWYAGGYLFTSPVAPLIAVLLVLASGAPDEIRLAIAMLIGTSILGFGAAYLVWQRIRADLAALAVVTRPPDRIGTTTDSVDSFLA
jgi:hypothetical protein